METANGMEVATVQPDLPFTLNESQRERLVACQAAWEEEGEEGLERLRQREEDIETLRAFTRLLAEADFARGGDLNYAQAAQMLALTRALAPNPNLDTRLLRQPGEPGALNRDLRDLLYGADSIPLRLRRFLQRRAVGKQTALQLLCAAYPNDWPIVTQTGLRALELTSEQRAAAITAARLRFDLPAKADQSQSDDVAALSPSATPALQSSDTASLTPEQTASKTPGETRRANVPSARSAPLRSLPDSDPVLRLLADVVIYTAVRALLNAADYLEVHRLLTQGLAARPQRRRRMPGSLLYPPHSSAPEPVAVRGPVTVREDDTPRYRIPSEPTAASPILSPPPDIAHLSATDVLAALERYVASRGFTYPPLTVRNYYLALQTKPFVLLSGLSGTGKTRLTSLFAEALTADREAQYRLLPVRPDWTTSAPLLGSAQISEGSSSSFERAVLPPFLDFLRRAERPENAHCAYFLCLDEMNLARIEHYFAEILSAMETPNRELRLPDGRITRLPANLFITGTLHLAPPAYPPSRKVLDRTNTIPFDEVCLQSETPAAETEDIEDISDGNPTPSTAHPTTAEAVFLQTRVSGVAAARAKLRRLRGVPADLSAQVVHTLSEVNALLEPYSLHVAYRVRDDLLCYCANSFDRDGRGLLTPDAPEDVDANLHTALDLQLLQKIVPRFSGSQEQLETPARALLQWAERHRFAQTARRLTRLLARLQRDGFAAWDE